MIGIKSRTPNKIEQEKKKRFRTLDGQRSTTERTGFTKEPSPSLPVHLSERREGETVGQRAGKHRWGERDKYR